MSKHDLNKDQSLNDKNVTVHNENRTKPEVIADLINFAREGGEITPELVQQSLEATQDVPGHEYRAATMRLAYFCDQTVLLCHETAQKLERAYRFTTDAEREDAIAEAGYSLVNGILSELKRLKDAQ